MKPEQMDLGRRAGRSGVGSGGDVGSGARDRPYRVESLAKGLRILSLFTEAQPMLRLNDVVEQAGVPMSTAFRLVSTLEQEAFIERLPDGLLRPGPAVLTLGFAALQGIDLVQTAAVVLRELADATGQTVNLGTLSGDRVLYMARIRNTDLVTASLQVGSVLPAVFASMGKVMLAHLDRHELEVRIGPESFNGNWGPKAVRSLSALRRQLGAVRAQGWGIQDEEVAYGLRSIAAPVRDASGGVVAAVNIAVQAPPWPIERIVSDLAPAVIEAANEISRRLGFSTRKVGQYAK